jgi:protein-S-isoprenylcysteine O-methyltransferase Ste14
MNRPRHTPPPLQGPVSAALATAAFCGLHSLLASRAAKRLTARLLGERGRNAFHRPVYNGLALGSFAALVRLLRRTPNRTLYHVKGPAAAAMGCAQVLAAGFAGAAAAEIGLTKLGGLHSVAAWARGASRVPREPEAQSLPPDAYGDIRPAGPFRFSRHPLNAGPIPLLWLHPRMTSTLAAFNAVATVYFYVGSLHSERRLRAAYGTAFETYRSSGVSFFVPRPPPAAGGRGASASPRAARPG